MKRKYTIHLYASDNDIRSLDSDPNDLDAACLGITIADRLGDAVLTNSNRFFVDIDEAKS